MTATYLLAGASIEVTSLYDEVHRMCAAYRTDQPAEHHVVTTQAQIEVERADCESQRQADGLPPCKFSDAYLETLAVYRQVATLLMEQGVLLMHGSAIAVDGEAYLFTALSGTGKSTHTRLWRQLFGPRAVMVNDDKPLVRVMGGERAIVYGTPWDGKHHLSNNIAVPLKAIIYLERGEQNEIHAVEPRWIFPILMQQTFRLNHTQGTLQALQLLGELAQRVKFYDLHCNMDTEAASVAYQGMN